MPAGPSPAESQKLKKKRSVRRRVVNFGDMCYNLAGKGARISRRFTEAVMLQGRVCARAVRLGRVRGRSPRLAGFSLLELTIAIAILMTILSITAQGLVSSHAVMRLQNQRNDAMNSCRAVISNLRQVARELPESTACPDGDPPFPCALMAWLDEMPGTSAEFFELSEEDREPYRGLFVLRDQEIQVLLLDADGNPAVTSLVESGNTNPVHVQVITRWTGARGRVFQAGLRTIITNR